MEFFVAICTYLNLTLHSYGGDIFVAGWDRSDCSMSSLNVPGLHIPSFGFGRACKTVSCHELGSFKIKTPHRQHVQPPAFWYEWSNDPMFKAEHKHVHQFKMCTCFVLFCKPGKNALSCYKLLLSHDPVTHIFFGYLLDIFWIISRFSVAYHGIPWLFSLFSTLVIFVGLVMGDQKSCDGQAEPSSCKTPVKSVAICDLSMGFL